MGLDLSLSALATALGSAVLHFLWQGAAIGVVAAFALALADKSRASARYWISCIALASCALAFVSTLGYALVPASITAGSSVPLPATPTPELLATVSSGGSSIPHQLIHGIAWLWITGVAVLQARLFAQCLMARRLTRHAVSSPSASWIEAFGALKHELRISPKVRLLRSATAEVPMVVGWLTPVVLVPMSAFASLTPEQLRAVLVHELAHIRRHDHVLNAIQIFIETALFFHPVTWWLSNQIRTERENCCDDAAVRSSPHPRVFAEALARLETIRSASPQAALAATGGPLMSRIARIVGTNHPTAQRATAWRATLAIAAGTIVAATGIAHALSADDGAQDQRALEIVRQYAEIAGAEDQRVRDLYDALIFNGSETQHAFDEHLAKINAELDAAIDAGKISHDEAARHLQAAQHELEAKHHALFTASVLGQTADEARLAMLRQQVADAVAAGRLSREQAQAKLAEARERQGLHAKFMAKTAEIRTKIHAAIDAGEISPEEGQQKMAEFERDLKIQFEHYEAKKKLAALVATGEVSQQQADEHLIALHHRAQAEHQKQAAELAAVKAGLETLAKHDDRANATIARTRDALQWYYQGLAVQATEPKQQHEHHLAVIHEHIAHAIDRGAMTPAEAVKMIDQLKQRVEKLARVKAEIADQKRANELAKVEALTLRGDLARAEQLYAELLHRTAQEEAEARDRAEVEARDRAEAERRSVEQQQRLAAYLIEAGIPREKVPSALGALERIAYEMKEEGKDFELNARLRGWLEDKGLTDENIDTLIDVARRRVGGTR